MDLLFSFVPSASDLELEKSDGADGLSAFPGEGKVFPF